MSSGAGERTEPVRRRGAALLASALVVVVAAVVVLLATAGGGGGGYKVRALFTYAANISAGENVKIAGVPVGTVGEVTATPQGLAAVQLNITNSGFQEFRKGATCRVRPQSFLGEKYVECVPVQPRAEGQPLPPLIPAISQGQEGAGEHLIPAEDTESPVEVDQLQDITRMPESQLLRILLNELGATFATRGPELRKLIDRANPGLRELDKVLKIFRGQNHLLANLAVEGDRALAPLAANRGHIADFIDKSKTVAQASARHLQALESDFAQLPAFLKQLGPAVERLGQFGEQALPTLTNLNVAAQPLGKAFEKFGPFSKSSDEYFTSLGATGKRTGKALKGIEPLLEQLQSLGGAAKPFAGNLSTLFTSLHKTGGVERLLDFIFLGAGATNGYDALGHFLRAEVVGDVCVGYQVSAKVQPSCVARYSTEVPSGANASSSTTAKAARYSRMSVTMARTLAVLEGATPQEAFAEFPDKEANAPASGPTPASKPVGGTASGTTYYAPGAEDPAISERLLEYLLGS